MSERTRHFLIGFPVAYVVITVLVLSLNVYNDFLAQRTDDRIKRAETSEYFVYSAVDYLGSNGEGGLRFESVREVYQPINVTWIDTLFCEVANGEFENYSNQIANGKLTTSSSPRSPWSYNGSYPRETPCYLESRIKGDDSGYIKEQTVVGKPFITPGE